MRARCVTLVRAAPIAALEGSHSCQELPKGWLSWPRAAPEPPQTCLGRPPKLPRGCPVRLPQLPGAAQRPLRLPRAAEEGRHNCPVQSTPRTKPMTDKATKLCCLDRSSTSLFKLSSRGGCREAHLDRLVIWDPGLVEEHCEVIVSL